MSSTFFFVFFSGRIGKQDDRPGRSLSKDGILYSGARYVAVWTFVSINCIAIYLCYMYDRNQTDIIVSLYNACFTILELFEI